MKLWQDINISVKAYFSLPFSRAAIFPLSSLMLLLGLWGGIYYKVTDLKNEAITENLRHVDNLAQTFEQYASRTVRQVDQITRFISFENRIHGFIPSLQALTENVLVSPASPVLLSVAAPNGDVYMSSKPLSSMISIADREHFIVPKNNTEDKLFIGKPVLGRVSKKVTIQISRRLTKANGTFDGVVVVSMDPSVFNSFYNPEDMKHDGFLGIVGMDGFYRSNYSSGNVKLGEKLINTQLLDKRSGTFIATNTHDSKHRFVAWRRIAGYDLIAIVGLSEDEFLANYKEEKALFIQFGIIASIAILLIGFFITVVYGRLELRRIMVLKAKEAYRTASEGTQDGFFILEPLKDRTQKIVDFFVTDANDKGAAMFSSTPHELVGSKLSFWFSGTMGEQLFKSYKNILATGKSLDQSEVLIECNNPLKNHWLSHRAVPTSMGLAITVRDITQSKTHAQSMAWLATHDAVTQLYNRSWLQNNLPDMMNKASQNNHLLALYFIDLDDFKHVNDTLGHAAGDILLSTVGTRLSNIVLHDDIVCRLGGDEFTLVVSGNYTHHELSLIGQDILHAIKDPMNIDGQMITIGASVGVSVYPEHATQAPELLKTADLAMYKAKDSGKGSVEFFLPELSVKAEERLQLERDMREGLTRDEFYLVYQPKVNLKTGKIVGMEALMRWQSPTRGLVNPMDFIPLAETTGLILPLGELAIYKACAQSAFWQGIGFNVPPISVNVSPKQLQRVDIAQQLQMALNKYNLHTHAIEIEITESSMMDDLDMSKRQLAAVKNLGVRILVDDFGTGYSSLSLLKQFKVDVLKVDKSFIHDVPHDAGDCALVQAVISMAQSLNMEVVAEGIETIEQLEFLKSLGCNEGQGYYFSRPVEAHVMAMCLENTTRAIA